MNKTWGWVVGILVAVVLLGVWYAYMNNGAAPAGSSQSNVYNSYNAPPAASTTTAPKTVNITVAGQNFSFSPSAITVHQGDTVKITFVNNGGAHNFVLEGYNVSTPVISGGQQASVTFVANKTGTFAYYCSVANHRAMGMEGTLTVQ